MIVREHEDSEWYREIEERNLKRQYDLLTDCIQLAIHQKYYSIDKFMLWSLNHAAVANLCQLGGRFRQEPVVIGDHLPPRYEDVPDLIDGFIAVIQEDWYKVGPLWLAAYGLWRLNWIHPFTDGNGRTARAVCYYLLSVRSGFLLPGGIILPERIREERLGYQEALRDADRAWHNGKLNLDSMMEYLKPLVMQQLEDATEITLSPMDEPQTE